MFLPCFGGLQTGRCFYEQCLYAVVGWLRALNQFDPIQASLPVRKSLCQASDPRISSALPAKLNVHNQWLIHKISEARVLCFKTA